MAAIGFFPINRANTLIAPKVIYQPSKPPLVSTPSQPVPRTPIDGPLSFPINRLPIAPQQPTGKTVPPPTDTKPWTVPTQPIPAAPGPNSPPVDGPAGGTVTGGTGGTDTSRLIDLIAGAFQPQDIGQSYGPQSVQSSATGSGTNPMAVVILAILVMAGVFLYAHRKRGAA